MPRTNSTTRAVGDDITASRLNDFNDDLDDLYLNGPDRLRVVRAISGTALRIDISAGAYYIGSTSGVYSGGTDIVVTNAATNYVMIDSSGTITISTSARTAGLGRLAQVICSGGAVTSIILRNNMVFGGAALDINALSSTSIVEEDDQYVLYKAYSGINMKVDAMRKNIQKSFECGETITTGDVVRLGTLAVTDVNVSGGSTESGNQGIGYSTTYLKQGQSFVVSKARKLKSISISLRKSGSPASQITCKVYSDQGTTLVATSTNTISEASLSAAVGGSSQTFNFSEEVLSTGTTYYYELSVPRANSTSNYSVMKVGSTYTGHLAYRINNTNTRTSHGTSAVFSVVLDEETESIYIGDSAQSKNIGIAEQSKTSGQQCVVTMKGIATAAGLTAGEKYEISTTGDIVVYTAGKYIGFALSATELFVDIDGGII